MPLTFVKLSKEELKRNAEYFKKSDFSRVHHTPRPNLPISKTWTPVSYILTSRHENSAEEIENFEVLPDDVYIVGFPKTGTTWTQEMVWQLCNNLNFEKGKSIELYERSSFIEANTVTSLESTTKWLSKIKQLPSPRNMKTHLPAPLLPKGIWTVKPRIIYITRNIKDTAISAFHYSKNVFGFKGNFNDYMNAFLNDAVMYSPMDAHVIDFWNMRHESNVLFLTYEEMKKDLFGVIQKTSKFLGYSYTTEQLKALEDHLSFSKMASNESVNYTEHLKRFSTATNADRDKDFAFMRKGKVGTFKEEMTPELIERFNDQIHKRHSEYKADPELLDILLGRTMFKL